MQTGQERGDSALPPTEERGILEEQARSIVDRIVNSRPGGGDLVAKPRHPIDNRPDSPKGSGEGAE